MLTLLGLVGAKRTIPAWLVETLQYVLSTFEPFFFSLFCSLGFYGGLRSSLASALDSAKYVRCEGAAALSFPFSIAEKSPPIQLYRRLSINARFSDAFLSVSAN